MAVSPTHPVDLAPAAAQHLADPCALDQPMATLLGLVERCGWRRATIACAGAMLLVGLGLATTLDAIIDARHAQLMIEVVLICLLAAPCLAIAFKLVEHLGRARTRLIIEIERRTMVEQHLRQLAVTDELTGIGNRRHFIARAQAAIEVARRYGQWCSVAMIDVDRFKAINDQRGHLAGDAALSMVAAALEANCRASDLAARLGGDEFVVLMPCTDPEAAAAAAERIRAAIRQNSAHLGLSVSVGVASVHGDKAECDALLARADQALYAAKRAGRNRVTTDPEAAARWSHRPEFTFSMAS